jgi:replicative DNA helicase
MTATVTPIKPDPALLPGAVELALADPVAGTTPPKYEFDETFQSKIAAMVLRDGRFMQRTDGLVEPVYFANQAEAQLVSLALDYFHKYKRIPADWNIYKQIIRESVATKRLRGEDVPNIVAAMKRMQEVDISDRDFVVDQVADFARYQALVQAFTESVGKLDLRDFKSIEKKINKALATGAHTDSNAYDYRKEIDSRTAERKDIVAGHRPPQGISTGYPALDDCLYHEGWGRGELAVLMGGAKAGKTNGLLQFGINACTAGFNVLYITLEVSAKILGARMDANISNTAFRDLKSNIIAVHDKVKAWSTKAGSFIVHEFPSGTMTSSELRRLIERYKALSINFDLVIVDYADIMAPERYTDSITENSKSVYVSLRAIAMQEQCAVLTATQTNREGFKASVAKAEHVAEDFNKIRIADVVISINATEEEVKEGSARLYFAACRNQAAGFSLRVTQDRERMQFIKTIVGRE